MSELSHQPSDRGERQGALFGFNVRNGLAAPFSTEPHSSCAMEA